MNTRRQPHDSLTGGKQTARAKLPAAPRRPSPDKRHGQPRVPRDKGQYDLFDQPSVAVHGGGDTLSQGSSNIPPDTEEFARTGHAGSCDLRPCTSINPPAPEVCNLDPTTVSLTDEPFVHGYTAGSVSQPGAVSISLTEHSGTADVSQVTVAAPPSQEGEEAVVNDCKIELSQATSRNPKGQIGGMPLLPQGNPMILTRHHINNLQNTGDGQALRDAVKLMREDKLNLHELARLGETGIANLVRRFVDESDLHRIPANMANPERLARRILFALSRLPQQFPDAGFPKVMAPGAISLLPLADDCKPARLKQEVGAWKPRLYGQPPGTGSGRPIKPQTAVEYPQKFWKVVQLGMLAGMDMNEFVGIDLFTIPKAIEKWLPPLRSHYAASTIAPILAAVSRIAADLLGEDHPNVLALRAAVGNNFHSQELPVEQIDDLRDAVGRNEDEMDVMTIWDIPSAIERRANAPRLTPADRESRITSAAAMEILLAISALSPEALSAINLATDVTRLGEWTLTYKDDTGLEHTEKLGDMAQRRILELEHFRQKTRRSSPWLFASKNRSKPQKRRIAMNALATNIQMTAGRRFNVVDIRDSIVVNAIDGRQADAKTISDAIHLKDPRSARRRFRIPIERPLEGEPGGAA